MGKIPLKVFTPVDFLKGKEKKDYMNNGKVVKYSMYDNLETIPKLDEIKQMKCEDAKKVILKSRENFSVSKLIKHWGITQYQFYNKLLKKYDINMGTTNGKRPKKQNKLEKTQPVQVVKEKVKISEISHEKISFIMKFQGNFNGSEIQEKLVNYASILEDGKKYNIQLIIREE